MIARIVSDVLPLFFQEDCRRVRAHDESQSKTLGMKIWYTVPAMGLSQLGTTVSSSVEDGRVKTRMYSLVNSPSLLCVTQSSS